MKNPKRLWDFYDGEPFMENPYLGILGTNPKRKKRGKKMAARKRRRTRRVRRTHGRKHTMRAPRRRRRASPRRRRRNPWTVAGSVIPMVANPRRRRRGRKHVSRRRRSTHRRSNPFGLALPPMKSVAFAGVGFIGPSIVSSVLTSTVPSLMTQVTGMGLIGKYVIRVASVLGLSWLTKRFVGVNEGNMVLIGGGVNVALTLVSDFAPGLLPANPLAMYIPTVFPPMTFTPGAGGMKQYVPLRGLRAVPPISRGIRQSTTAAAFPTMPGFATGGSYGGAPARFKRF